jgi:hypothetical protein
MSAIACKGWRLFRRIKTHPHYREWTFRGVRNIFEKTIFSHKKKLAYQH